MCGRFAFHIRAEDLRETFGVAGAEMLPRYNVGPEQHIAVIRATSGERKLAMLRWGFPVVLPGEARAKLVINARGETMDVKPTFRDAFRNRRCLIPASGFYEWQAASKGHKQPFYIHPKNGRPFAMAGIWEQRVDADGVVTEYAAIVTCEANAALKPMHERMPVILMPADWDTWLTGTPETAKGLIRPAPEDFFEAYPVSTAVNRMANNGPDLIRPEAAAKPVQKKLF